MVENFLKKRFVILYFLFERESSGISCPAKENLDVKDKNCCFHVDERKAVNAIGQSEMFSINEKF